MHWPICTVRTSASDVCLCACARARVRGCVFRCVLAYMYCTYFRKQCVLAYFCTVHVCICAAVFQEALPVQVYLCCCVSGSTLSTGVFVLCFRRHSQYRYCWYTPLFGLKVRWAGEQEHPPELQQRISCMKAKMYHLRQTLTQQTVKH